MPLKYEEIAEWLRQAIAAGTYPPGSKLPSGRDLCERWQVSRATVNKALEQLKADALVESRQGSGYIVLSLAMARPVGTRGSGTRRVDGSMPFTRLGVPQLLEPPPHIAHALGLRPGEQALQRIRLLHLADGTPHSLATAWFPAWIVEQAPRLAGAAAIAEGTTRYMRRCTGLRPERGEDVESIRMATAIEAAPLELAQASPVHVVVHTARDDRRRPLVVEEGVTPASAWRRVTDYPMGE